MSAGLISILKIIFENLKFTFEFVTNKHVTKVTDILSGTASLAFSFLFPFSNESNLKGKEFVPVGANSFPLRVDNFLFKEFAPVEANSLLLRVDPLLGGFCHPKETNRSCLPL